MLLLDGIKVIDGLKAARLNAFARLFHGFFHLLVDFPFRAIDGFRHRVRDLHFFRNLFVGPVHSGNIGEEVEGEIRIVAQKGRHDNGARGREAQRVLRGRTGIGHKLHARAGNRRFNRHLDLFHRLHFSSQFTVRSS